MRLASTLLLAAAFTSLASADKAFADSRPAGEFAIQMNDGSQKLLSSLRGKTVCMAFFYTTCPHCQDVAGVLGKVQAEYAPKGVQVVAAAFNDNAKDLTPEFNQRFVHGAFPMGYSDRGAVLEFLQKSIMTPLYVPVLVFVDKHGTIIDEYIGDATFLKDPPKNIREELNKILAMKSSRPAVKISHK